MDQALGHVDLGVVGHRLQHRLFELALGGPLVGLGQTLAEVLAQLVERVELGRLGGELVVELGQPLGLDLVHGDLERRRLAGELLAGIVVGERHLDGLDVARGGAEQLLLEPRDQVAGAELDQLVAARAALERLTLERADVVDDDLIARRRGALHGLERRHPVAQLLDLLVDRRLLHLGLTPADLDALVLAELGLRADADLDRELQRLALVGKIGHVEVGLADRGDPGLVDRVDVPVAQRRPHGLVEHGLAAEAADHDRRRDLALAKARDPHRGPESLGGLLQAALDLVGRDLGRDANP